jgi:hypothetical protein
VADGAHTGVVPPHGFVATLSQPVQALFTQKFFAGLAVQRVLSMHSTHWPAKVPVAAQAALAPVHAAVPAFWQPAQALFTQNPLAGSCVQPLASTHSTHCPANVPLVAHAVLPSVLAAQPVAPVVSQPVHAFATQKALPGSATHWPSAVHCTHWPADVPLAEQAVLPSVRTEQPVAPVVLQPVQALATQKPLAGSFVHCPSAAHSTHFPEAASHTCVPQAFAAVWQPTHDSATQKLLVGSVQSLFTAQVPEASGTREACESIAASSARESSESLDAIAESVAC